MTLFKNQCLLLLVLPAGVAITMTVPFYLWDIDMALARRLYQDGNWLYGQNPVVRFLYDYGPFPAIATTVAGLALFVTSFFVQSVRRYRRIGALLVLLLVLGSGVVVNMVFKEYWGRPRPRQVVEFGGEAEYVLPLKKAPFVVTEKTRKWALRDEGAVIWGNLRNFAKLRGKYNSFPAGHASVGFYMMVPFFFIRSKNGRILWLSIGISFGLIMGMGRMLQGAHFLSDVIWAGFMIYFTGLFLHYFLVKPHRDTPDQDAPPAGVSADGSL